LYPILHFYRKFTGGITPLPSIMDLINNMKSNKVFMKMDLWWGFNNIRIKEENEWKRVYIMYVELFELTIMFFGITDLLVMFQAIMREILRDLVNKEKVTVFVDNVLVKTESKKEHDEIVEEILRRLKENDLYVKLEKYM